MGLLTRMLGSKYDKNLPYTYEAVVNVLEDDDSMQVCYFADTICGLTDDLARRRENPRSVAIFEIFQGKKTLIPQTCYLSEDGEWLPRSALCCPMTSRYGEPSHEGNCPFRDRSTAVCGP
jgi:hypothetical protein